MQKSEELAEELQMKLPQVDLETMLIYNNQFENEMSRNERKTKSRKEKQTCYNHQNLDRYQKRLKKYFSKQSQLDDSSARIVS